MEKEKVYLKLPDEDTVYVRKGPVSQEFAGFLVLYEKMLKPSFGLVRLGGTTFAGYLNYKIADKDLEKFFDKLKYYYDSCKVPYFRREEIFIMLASRHTILKMDGWPYSGSKDKHGDRQRGSEDASGQQSIFNVKYTSEYYIYSKIAEWLGIAS